MYPTLQTDPAKAAWIKNTVAELAAFGEQHRMELDTANRANKFLRELYRELGGRGYLGPSSQSSAAGWGGGVPEYVVISEEVGRHGLVSGQIAAQAIDADLVHRYMMGPHDGAWVSRFRFRKRLTGPSLSASQHTLAQRLYLIAPGSDYQGGRERLIDVIGCRGRPLRGRW